MQITEDYQLLCEFQCFEFSDIEDQYIVDQLYHIAQEAALNAAKHSGADLISIYLSQKAHNILLRVVDNGSGFNKTESEDHGLGMRIMPYRAATIGARLCITDAVGGGTQVACSLEYDTGVSKV